MRVTFRYKNGREKVMSERDASLLTKLGHGEVYTASRPTYQTRDMQAAAPVPAAAEPVESSLEDDTDDEQEDKPKRRGRPPKVTQE